ncbi:MAG: glycosyltransferase family 2 protein [Bacteroidales bacterium]|nr:glycosyltransferase family 2 protein [Bacteroidales bacterium]MDD4603109.1 glycosyltransferase family 2 protein [Bacteroidales bacterium]
MHVAVIILNWNGRNFLEKFLPTLVQYSKDEAEIIVADNFSSDDSLEFVRSAFPEIRIIRNASNYGFARGYNEALNQVTADYYILLNSDIEVTANWIQPVITLMESDPLIAACQPKIRSYLEPKKFEYAGAAGGFIDKYGYPFCRGRIFLSIEEDTGQYDEPCEIFWATGACMFVKANLFHSMGGLDEDFFAHMEEIDFCWRLKNNGFKIMFCPSSTVFHIGGGTLPKVSCKKTYLNFRNNFFLLYKNLPENRLNRVFTVRFILDGIAACKFLIQAGFMDFWAVTRAHISFYHSLSKTKEKRKNLRQGSMKNVFDKNIVIEYYLRGKKKFTDLDPKSFYDQ